MKVLLATDGSENALEAASFLSSLGHKQPVEITLLTVSYLPENLHSRTVASWYPQWQAMESSRIDTHHQELEATLKGVPGLVTRLTKSGNPTHVIIKTAEELDSDLVVIGARGHSRLERMLIGSVSDAVATHAPCSVVVVRPDREKYVTKNAEVEPPPKAHKVLLGYDGSPSAKDAIADFKHFDWQGNSALVLSVHQVFDGFGQDYAELYELQKELPTPNELTTEASQLIGNCCDDLSCLEANGSHIGQTLTHEAFRHRADLVMVGDNGHGMLEQFLLGSTSKYILRHADCSVWISRQKLAKESVTAKDAETSTSSFPATALSPGV